MQIAKLTINMDEVKIDFLKKYTKKSSKTISEIIAQFQNQLKKVSFMGVRQNGLVR